MKTVKSVILHCLLPYFHDFKITVIFWKKKLLAEEEERQVELTYYDKKDVIKNNHYRNHEQNLFSSEKKLSHDLLKVLQVVSFSPMQMNAWRYWSFFENHTIFCDIFQDGFPTPEYGLCC